MFENSNIRKLPFITKARAKRLLYRNLKKFLGKIESLSTTDNGDFEIKLKYDSGVTCLQRYSPSKRQLLSGQDWKDSRRRVISLLRYVVHSMRKLVFVGVEVILPDEVTVEVFSPKIKLWLVNKRSQTFQSKKPLKTKNSNGLSIADAIIDLDTNSNTCPTIADQIKYSRRRYL